MSSEFDKIRQDIRAFNEQVKNWDEDQLSDEELDEVNELLEETIELITGASLDEEDEETELID
jgi:hypothetical protein